ncbi:hypothetical protein [Paraburkholderia sp. BCC1886]|uniref:hypothetical protein n=1 Tax=Paraburkholderia sp. BCC1886 TaxID=2562670 RepID=UPI0011841ED6|nr:hypothetical protein [Paraburkholderia sp. BCC1886]
MKHSLFFVACRASVSLTLTANIAIGAIAAIAAIAALSGCSSSPPLFMSDGRATTLVQCPVGSDSCVQQANASCGGAYDTVRESRDNGTFSLIYACRAK